MRKSLRVKAYDLHVYDRIINPNTGEDDLVMDQLYVADGVLMINLERHFSKEGYLEVEPDLTITVVHRPDKSEWEAISKEIEQRQIVDHIWETLTVPGGISRSEKTERFTKHIIDFAIKKHLEILEDHKRFEERNREYAQQDAGKREKKGKREGQSDVKVSRKNSRVRSRH